MSSKYIQEQQILKFAMDEFADYVIYKELSKREKNENYKMTLEKLAEIEKTHFEFWKSLSHNNFVVRISSIKVFILYVFRIIFGLTFTLKLFERHEKETIKAYEYILPKLKEEDKQVLLKIIKDEKEHESYFMSQINESVVKYMSFVVLGLADAIIEITGVHAGFLGVTSSTLIAGIAGLVVGFAASISMASAAYLQAKHGASFKPLTSATITGTSYLGAVSFLALPYFFITEMLMAFLSSLSFAIIMIAIFTTYGAVLREESITKEFVTGFSLTIGTAFAAFLFGEALGRLFGIHTYMS
ncbi:MAG: VIT1/CCC1 family protein [Nitrososphaerota archaeon]